MSFGVRLLLNVVCGCCAGFWAEFCLAKGWHGRRREHAHDLVQGGVVKSCGLLQGSLMLKPILGGHHREANQQQDAEQAHSRAGAAIGEGF